MTRPARQVLAVATALMLVTAAFGLAVSTGALDGDDSPIGESQAVVCGGWCIAGVALTGIAVGGAAVAAFSGEKQNASALQAADASETQLNVYESAVVQGQNNAILTDSYSNYLSDTEEVALMIGKNAYIRALNNNTAEGIARQRAKEAVSDYYATKQIQILRQWSVSFNYTQTLNSSLTSAGVDQDMIILNHTIEDANAATMTYHNVTYGGTNSSVLVNGSIESFHTARVYFTNDDAGHTYSPHLSPDPAHYANIGGNSVDDSSGTDPGEYSISVSDDFHAEAISVLPPEVQGEDVQGYTAQTFIEIDTFVTQWRGIESQNADVHSQLDDFVDATYESYQSGEIDNSDLVDPYIGSRSYDPEANYETWTIRSLTSIGVNPPENLSTTKHMVVRDHTAGVNYTGVLMSDGVPESGGFEVGKKYDAGSLTGYQYVINGSDGTTDELTGNFTLMEARYPNGTEVDGTINYREINYQTTNITELEETLADIQDTQAEIDSRQQRLRAGGGGLFAGIGGAFGLGLNGTQIAAIILLIVIVVIAVVTNRN